MANANDPLPQYMYDDAEAITRILFVLINDEDPQGVGSVSPSMNRTDALNRIYHTLRGASFVPPYDYGTGTTPPPGTPVLSSPSFVQQNTTITNDMGSDGYSWAQARPITVDKYGKLFALAENSVTVHCFTFSNDGGVTWSDGLTQSFITRGTVAYDDVNDIVHVLWQAELVTDGIIYRRYTISRDGSHNITGFTRDMSVNLQLDFRVSAAMDYSFPCLLWLDDAVFGTYGAVVAVWGARNNDDFTSEVRSSMRILSNDANDNIASNWHAPVTLDTTTVGDQPNVPYSSIAAPSGGGVSVCRKTAGTHALDIYCIYCAADFAQNIKFKRLRWNTNDWSTGLTSAVTIVATARSGTDTGYALKVELPSFPWEDVNHDLIYIGLATWKSDVAGDTWTVCSIDGSDVVGSPIDVYSAGGAHSYAPTGDILFDNTLDALVVSYSKTATQAVYAQVFRGGVSIQSEILLFDTAAVDIPLLGGRLNSKLLCMFRDTGSPRHGWFGSISWA